MWQPWHWLWPQREHAPAVVCRPASLPGIGQAAVVVGPDRLGIATAVRPAVMRVAGLVHLLHLLAGERLALDRQDGVTRALPHGSSTS